MKKKISIIIPVFNSTDTLVELLKKITKLNLKNYEVIFVEDNSKNLKTKKILLSLAKKYKKTVKVILLSKNLGRTEALLIGLRYSKGENNIIMDDDLQHDPKYINKFLSLKKHDLVFANYSRKKDIFNNLLSYMKYLLDKITFENKVRISSYFMINDKTKKKILSLVTHDPYLPGLINSATTDIVNFDIILNKRNHGKSNYNFARKFMIIKNIFLNYSNLPYKILLCIGLMTLLFSFILGGQILYNYINYNPQPGWTSTIFLIIFFGSISLLVNGLIGFIIFTKLNHLIFKKNQDLNIKKIIFYE